jgi:hypothetical protein
MLQALLPERLQAGVDSHTVKEFAMSLDVSLTMPPTEIITSVYLERISIREDGQIKEISREEWDRRFPGRKPITIQWDGMNDEVYSANITHNLTSMADAAGIYQALWRPEEIGITKAEQLIEPLRKGLALLKDKPTLYRQFNPSNGWGNYEGLVSFVEGYLAACQEHPMADVSVSR